MLKLGRPKGSKNKVKGRIATDLNIKAKNFADKFIAQEHIKNAEILAIKILERIRNSKEQLEKKYGGVK